MIPSFQTTKTAAKAYVSNGYTMNKWATGVAIKFQ
jgi:hypothetical protein